MWTWLMVGGAVVGLASAAQGALQWRLARAMAGTGPGRRLRGRVVADSFLRAPVSHERCVLFVLSLARQKQDDTAGQTLSFREQRPFAVACGDERIRVEGDGHPFALLGVQATRQALPMLPATVEGLLVARFGRKGSLWAREHAVNAEELLLRDGAEVDIYVADGHVAALAVGSLDGYIATMATAAKRGVAIGVLLLAASAAAWWTMTSQA